MPYISLSTTEGVFGAGYGGAHLGRFIFQRFHVGALVNGLAIKGHRNTFVGANERLYIGL